MNGPFSQPFPPKCVKEPLQLYRYASNLDEHRFQWPPLAVVNVLYFSLNLWLSIVSAHPAADFFPINSRADVLVIILFPSRKEI
jgi:hypothetical protein